MFKGKKVIIREQNISAKQCLVIEDSLIGVEAAKNAEIECVCIYDKYSDNDREKISQITDYSCSDYNEMIEKLDMEIK